MLKFFKTPFASSGDRTTISEAVDVGGLVSYEEGYGYDYERAVTDPQAKYIERDKNNQLYFDITTALQELQSQGVPDFITSALNGGSAYSYDVNAVVRYNGGLYRSLVSSNTSDPTDLTKWQALFAAGSVSVNTVANILTLPKTGVALAQALGYYGAGDGGGGDFYLDLADVTTGATFTGSQSGTTLTISSVATGAVYVGMRLHRIGHPDRYITALGTGTGGTGTYTVSVSQTLATGAFTGDDGGSHVVAYDGGRWHRRDFVSPTMRHFGAVSDSDVTDNALPLYAAQRYCGARSIDLTIDLPYYITRLPAEASDYVSWVGRGEGSLIASHAAWPYASSSAPLIKIPSGGYCTIDGGLVLDQNWLVNNYAHPTGYDDSIRSELWGGYWFIQCDDGRDIRLPHVAFKNCARGAQFTAPSKLMLGQVVSDGVYSATQCVVGVSNCLDASLVDFRATAPRWDTVSTWYSPTYPVTYPPAWTADDRKSINGGAAIHSIACNWVVGNIKTVGHQLVFRGVDVALPSPPKDKTFVVTGEINVECPIADTAMYGYFKVVGPGGFRVRKSGDMGVPFDGVTYVNIGYLECEDIHVGCFNVTDAKSVKIGRCHFKNYAQAYAQIGRMYGRYASGAGPWLAAATANYKNGGNSKNVCLPDVTLEFTKAPPVSDTLGSVRANVFGVFFEDTQNTASLNTGTVCNARIPQSFVDEDTLATITAKTDMPNLRVVLSTHRLYFTAHTGTPVPGQLFTSGSTSTTFILNTFDADGNHAFIQNLRPAYNTTINAGEVFTGENGATLTAGSTPSPGLTRLGNLNYCNFDYTNEYVL